MFATLLPKQVEMLSDTVQCVSADSSALEKPQLHSTICYIYHKLDILWHDFCIDSLLKTLSFDHNFSVSARSTSFFRRHGLFVYTSSS